MQHAPNGPHPMSEPRNGRSAAFDRDAFARLEEEREFLLRSLDDLDQEYAAGDVDEADYQELKAGYVARAAEVLRAIEAGQDELESERQARAAAPGRRKRGMLWLAGALVFAVLAGVLLAKALGSRSEGQALTGVDATDPGSRCQRLTFQKPAEGIACYNKVLADSPDDLDALTYQGWAYVRSGDTPKGSASFDRVVALNPKYPDVYVFRAVVAKDASEFVTAQQNLDTLYSLNPPPSLLSTMQQMGLDSAVAVGLLPAATKACWEKLDPALTQMNTVAGKGDSATDTEQAAAVADLVISIDCFDTVLAATPSDVDALTMRSFAAALLDPRSVAKAKSMLDQALQIAPADPSALLVRAAVDVRLNDLDGATSDLDALGDRRAKPFYSLLDRASIRSAIKQAAQEDATTTSTP
jgi:tetratricopeptide (TPR) repeat protein